MSWKLLFDYPKILEQTKEADKIIALYLQFLEDFLSLTEKLSDDEREGFYQKNNQFLCELLTEMTTFLMNKFKKTDKFFIALAKQLNSFSERVRVYPATTSIYRLSAIMAYILAYNITETTLENARAHLIQLTFNHVYGHYLEEEPPCWDSIKKTDVLYDLMRFHGHLNYFTGKFGLPAFPLPDKDSSCLKVEAMETHPSDLTIETSITCIKHAMS